MWIENIYTSSFVHPLCEKDALTEWHAQHEGPSCSRVTEARPPWKKDLLTTVYARELTLILPWKTEQYSLVLANTTLQVYYKPLFTLYQW